MPPNRQSLVDISDALSSINVSSLVKEETAAAFAPLSDQDFIAPNQEEEEDDVVVTNPNASDSYWDWPAEPKSEKQEIIDSIVQQERIRQVLSVEHIEETLTTPSSSYKDDTEEDDSCRLVQAHDDYWNMPSETDNVQEPNNVMVVAQHVQDVTHPKNSYWDWDTSEDCTDKDTVIAKVLRDEEARHLTSVQHVQENLLRAAVVQPESSAESTTRTRHVDASHDEYWQWSSSDVVVTASHVGDQTHPRSSYWDWQSSQQTTDSNSKQATIDKILRDEQARQVMLHEPQASCQPSSPQHMVSAAGDDDNNSSSYWEW